ncbi:glycosyltransferase family 4 protein [Lactobacillus sp. ESL0233]|uniref:glycosyltransferase n=1 Tax=Lactobacillus sp. ESL0233 TaxID=2069354 RepID=UPI000EFB9063|nr:glycosyltransferase [Lactobacillus sp. ESL0233]RMC42409.1 glycosyltransferase family 4 protein [Lactobacillus sp. ESL0233]
MKILHVNAGLENGGGLTHIVNLLRQAKAAGQDFTLLCLAPGPVASAAANAQLNVHVLGVNNRYDLTGLKRLRTFINQGEFDIVHTHGARANLFIALIKHKIKAKWCVTVHSDPYLDFADHGILGHVFTTANLYALRQAECVFAVTQKFAQLLVTRANLDANKVHAIYNGTKFHANSAIPAKEEHQCFNLVNVARTEKVKGQDLLLKALKIINNPNVHLYIAGNGTQLASLKKLAQKLELTKQVTFLGFISQKQLENLYRKMDLAVLTSYSESFPLVLLEASDNLLPLLSTAVGDIKMMIPDKQHGFIATVGNINSIAANLKKAIELSKEQLSQMALSEKEYAASRFSLKKQLESILKVYEVLLAE